MKRVVLDASAVMTFFLDRPGAEKVEELMKLALDRKRELLMSVVNWGEIYYAVWRANGQQAANQVAADLAQLPIKLIEIDLALTKCAASFRAQYKLPYIDCFVAALAETFKAEIVTSDQDFTAIQNQLNVAFI